MVTDGLVQPRSLVSDRLCELLTLPMPLSHPSVHGRASCSRRNDRAALERMVLVLRAGICMAEVLLELNHGLGWMCWRRVRQ
ncbi:hypothetical protein GCM10027586_20180 [Kineococcus gypseus]|uniref:hypothetical protein n=1 Tax=Kineococcus gypseus TaxID=1637102 RepID=UPI003D7ED3DD